MSSCAPGIDDPRSSPSESVGSGPLSEADRVLQEMSINLPSFMQDTPSLAESMFFSKSAVAQEAPCCKVMDDSAETDERLAYVKQSLMSMNCPGIGDMYSQDKAEVKKTVDTLYALVRMQQIGLDQRKKHSELLQKSKNELMIVQKKLELMTREKDKLQKELGKLENTLATLRDQIRKSTSGEKTNKDDFKQTMLKMEQKLAQSVHEQRKKESLFGKMQEQYRKATKETVMYKNGIEITSALEAEGFSHVLSPSGGAAGNLCYMLKIGYEECQKRLVEENGRLKECLELTQKEMTAMLNKVVDTLKRTVFLKKDPDEMHCVEPIQLKPIVFQMPLGTLVNDIYQIFRENMCRMRDGLDSIISNV